MLPPTLAGLKSEVSAKGQYEGCSVRCPYDFILKSLLFFRSSAGTYPTSFELGFGNANGILTLGALNEVLLAGKFTSFDHLIFTVYQSNHTTWASPVRPKTQCHRLAPNETLSR